MADWPTIEKAEWNARVARMDAMVDGIHKRRRKSLRRRVFGPFSELLNFIVVLMLYPFPFLPGN